MNYFYLIFIPTLLTLFLLSKYIISVKRQVYHIGRIDFLAVSNTNLELELNLKINDYDNGFFDELIEMTGDISLFTELANHYSQNKKIMVVGTESVFSIPHITKVFIVN
jgi:hypothetical protein